MKLLDRIFGILRPTPISTAAVEGVVYVAGTVRATRTLVAPYTGRACVYWRLEISHSAFQNSWRDVAAQQCDFEIFDPTGRATVFAERCTYDVGTDTVATDRASSISELAPR